jgi:hypothetical protein
MEDLVGLRGDHVELNGITIGVSRHSAEDDQIQDAGPF